MPRTQHPHTATGCFWSALLVLQSHMAQLQEGIKTLGDHLRAEVLRRQAALLQQAEALREAQSFMQVQTPHFA